MSAHYFVSDAHLGASPPGTEERLLAFLRSIRGKADSLYILGDLFDFWFEYGSAIPKHGFRVLTELAKLADAGTRVVYLSGNHDLRLRDFFSRELGIETAAELEETIDGVRVWMKHGEETDRRWLSVFFRRLMRSRLNNFLYSFIHPDAGIRFANWVATRSRARGLDPGLKQKMRESAQEKLCSGADVAVMAHVHEPELLRTGSGVYVNTGDWLRHFSYAVIRDGEVMLEYFKR
ncbi:MAG: UDP-2,3-diacylglucosamine diphosphatase [candidate division WOR-3 bacterium]|nr:MAG: UDP-2,3-diacylglucosamine diphosphatase [candidate division WOR-3 bacterium]